MRDSTAKVPVREEVLPGFFLTSCTTDRFKVGYLSVRFLLPASRGASALRALLLKVLCRGTEKYPTMARLNLRFDELYATPFGLINQQMNGYTCVGFSMDLLGRDYLLDETDLIGEVLEVVTQILCHPLTDGDGGLSDEYVESERKNLIDQIRALANVPSAFAMGRFLDEFYGDGTYAHIRTLAEEDVKNVSRDALGTLWRSLVRSVPIECVYVGEKTAAEVAATLRAHFAPEIGDLPGARPPVGDCILPPAASVHGEGIRTVEEEYAAGQSHLIVGCHTGVLVSSPMFYAMLLCHEILGGSPISRLFVHVREEHGLCYTCASEYSIARGDIVITCGIRAERREEAQDAIFAQLDALKRGDFTEAELVAARKSLDSGYRQLPDSPKGLSDYYMLRRLFGVGDTVEECRERIAAVTREDVIAAAKLILPDTVYFLRGVGPDAADEDGEAGEV